MNWHYVTPDQKPAQVPAEDLAQLVASGTITAKTLVWNETMTEWRPAGELLPNQFGGLPAGAPVTHYGTGYGYPGPRAAEPPASGLAVASLVCGILALTLCPGIAGIPAVICGHMVLGQIRAAPGAVGGRGLAIAGLVTGYISIAFTLVYLVVVVLFLGIGMAAAGASGTPYP
jgi:hypothetical protein